MAEPGRQLALIAAFAGPSPDPPPDDLGPVLARICDDGRRAWPTLAVDEVTFCRFLGERVAVERVMARDEPVLAADLYLACACVLGVPSASRELVHACDAPVRAALARILEPADRSEVVQRVWENLIVADPPRIGQYRGDGTLLAFVRVAAVRQAISERRKTRPVGADALELLHIADDADDPELQYLKQHYRAEFRRSFATAFAGLPAAQQLLLRLDVVEQLTIDQAAAVYGRSRTTTGRHLLEARQALAHATLADLQTRLGLESSELRSLSRLVRSAIDLSVQQLLAEPT